MRVLALAMNQNGSKQGRGRGPSALDDAVYSILLALLVNAYTCAPKSERSKEERVAVRKRKHYDVQTTHNPLTGQKETRLVYKKSGKIALKRCEVTDAIRKEYQSTKKEGARKLYHRIGRYTLLDWEANMVFKNVSTRFLKNKNESHYFQIVRLCAVFPHVE